MSEEIYLPIIISDDFNDNDFDTTKWTKESSGDGNVNDIIEQNQRLEMSLSECDEISSVQVVSNTIDGDFDIQVDWDISLLDSNSSWSSFRFLLDDNNLFLIKREYNNSHFISCNVRKIGVWQTSQTYYTTATTGKYRITRIDSTVKFYYDIGADWVLLGTYTDCQTGSGQVRLRTYLSGNYPDISCYWDNFIRVGEEEEIISLSDNIELKVSLEKLELSDTLNLSDNLSFGTRIQENEDTAFLSDEIEVLLSKDLSDVLDIEDEILVAEIETVRSDIYNSFGMVGQILSNVDNKISVVAEEISDIINDIRFLKSWQVAGDAGYQSLGKTYVKVYINDEEQTDAIIDSITISKLLNGSHTASFNLGKPYDNSKPDQESEVEIKYHTWILYKGYITQITPTNNPEEIKIICQDEYWKQNKTKKYFHVGHRPSDNFELYYNIISSALSTQFGWNPGIGEFVPQNMNCFGVGSSDCISNLIQNSGNYAWYYDYDKTKKLWIAGQGSIVNLEKQEIGKNLGLYQVLSHSFRENIENIVNKYRVQMGDWVWRRYTDSGASRKYPTYSYWVGQVATSPDWNSTYERLAKDSPDGYGLFHHPESQNQYYDDVFTKYKLPFLNPKLSSWTDRFPPTVEILLPFSLLWELNIKVGTLTEGFTIDYENGYLVFNEPIYLYQLDENGELEAIRKPDIRLLLSKKEYYSNTEDPSDDPTSDISNPLMFFTDKMGDYPETIMNNLELSNFSIQIGYYYKDDEGVWHTIPSWNDTLFAKDYANWQLSKTCDKKINGTVNLTLDAICFYDIDLTKRIKITGVMDTPLNIISMTYNIGNWGVSLELQNDRYYKRTASLPSHGE